MTRAACHDPLLDAMMGDFLDESGQLLARLNENLLLLDAWVNALSSANFGRSDETVLNELFRAAHSLKGLSAMLGLGDINVLTHKLENIFDAARNHQLSIDAGSVELMFQSIDRLEAMVAYLKEPGAEPPEYQHVSSAIQAMLDASGTARAASTQEDAERLVTSTMEQRTAPNDVDASMNELRQEASRERFDWFADVTDETDVPRKYLAIFIDETYQSLDSLSDTLLQEECRADPSATENLLIVSHRIKGSAASIGLNRPAKLAHRMEDLLQDLREQRSHLTGAMTEALLRCTDALRRYVDGLRAGVPDASDFNEVYHQLMEACQSREAAALPAATVAPGSSVQNVDGPVAERLSDAETDAIRRMVADGTVGVLGRVQFQPEFPLIGLKARLVYERLAQLGEVFHCDPAAERLENLEQLGQLTFGLATSQSVEVVAASVRIVAVEEVEAYPLKFEAPAAQAECAPPSSDARVVGGTVDRPGPAPLRAPGDDVVRENASRSQEAAGRPAETLRVDIDRLDQLMNLAGQLVINKARFVRIGDGLKQAAGSKRLNHRLDGVFGRLDVLEEALDAGGRGDRPVELDSLRGHVLHLQRDLELVRSDLDRMAGVRASVNDLFEAVHQLDRVADGIQRTVMDTRMVPIGPLFGRFRRVVRDITRGNGKDVRLDIRGEKTELDKRMIDELGDPLIHMVRNAADHGIESPERRLAAGKPAQGVVTLNAFHRGNRIIIQVIDDGQGLDPERIRRKAVERGLVNAESAERLTLHQVYNLIWEPGFSTAEQVTEISGRGMGMDIVKTKIEEINGAVDVDSVPGRGCTFTIKLPLTLAILPSLMAELHGDVFALPIESVVEIVRVQTSQIKTIQRVPTAIVRGRVISLVRLEELLTWNAPATAHRDDDAEEITMVIIGSEGQELGLVVDRLLGEDDIVIKSLAENYRNIQGVAGASILGDGRVALILDIAALLELAAHGVAARHLLQETSA